MRGPHGVMQDRCARVSDPKSRVTAVKYRVRAIAAFSIFAVAMGKWRGIAETRCALPHHHVHQDSLNKVSGAPHQFLRLHRVCSIILLNYSFPFSEGAKGPSVFAQVTLPIL